MSDTKLKLKDLGTIHLMALDGTSLFLPFGRPISEYLLGNAGTQNGSRVFLNRGAIDFPAVVRWEESIASLLQTTGFGELERAGLVEPEPAPAAEPDPGMADFLRLEGPSLAIQEPNLATTSPAVPHAELPVSLPRVLALPLRQRMTFGPAPQKAKPAPAAAPKPAAVAPAPKAATTPAPNVTAPPKQNPAPPAKPAATAPPAKASPPAPAQAKQAAPIPPAPKPGPTAAPASRVTVLQPPPPPAAPKTSTPKTAVPAAPAARTPESTPAPGKPVTAPPRAPVAPAARANENVAPPPKPAPVPPAAARTSTPVTTSRPLVPPFPPERGSSSTGMMEQAAAHEVIARETPKPKEPAPSPKAKGPLSITDSAPPAETATPSSFEPNLGGADSASLFERIPMLVKIGVALSVVAGGLYFGLGKSSEKPAANKPVFVGEQGWSTEWASDAVGSRKARQLTMYRPSAGLSDYQFQFAGQIESKAIGWIFRASDTKNYYAMKLEQLKPGVMGLTHFAVVDGRESSNSQKPLTLDARPGAIYNVKLDVTGPRFTVSIQGEPVEFWTDNRLKSGSVGLMNERDERGVASAVQFSFTQVSK